eukprot:6963535-Prymnesium_polylepis.1
MRPFTLDTAQRTQQGLARRRPKQLDVSLGRLDFNVLDATLTAASPRRLAAAGTAALGIDLGASLRRGAPFSLAVNMTARFARSLDEAAAGFLSPGVNFHVHHRRISHLKRLQHTSLRAIEERKVELHCEVAHTRVYADALRAGQPAGQWAHILAREPQPERIWPEHPALCTSLHIADLRWRVGRKSYQSARHLGLLAHDHSRRHASRCGRTPALHQAFDKASLGGRQPEQLEKLILVQTGYGQNPFGRCVFHKVSDR